MDAPLPAPNAPGADLKLTDVIAFNRQTERAFVHWLAALIEAQGEQPAEMIIADAAFVFDVSTATIKRYLAKWTSRFAPFAITDGHIRFREVPK